MKYTYCLIVFLSLIIPLTGSEPKSVVTVFYQGMNNTQAQAARLVGKQGFEYPYTGEKVTNEYALECILNLTVHPEIEEVELLDTSVSRWQYLLRPYAALWLGFTALSHCYNGTQFVPLSDTIQKSAQSLRSYVVRVWDINLGQTKDLAEHKKRFESAHAAHSDADIVLYGVSRGALTTFNAHATEQYEGVKAVILEGCPSAMPEIILTTKGFVAYWLYQKYAKSVCAHDPQGISALACVHRFPKQTPVLFITSKKDTVVPAGCTTHLAQKLANSGHKYVYCLVLDQSSHIGYCWDNKDDARNYQNVVHAFYKKYGIAGYNEQYAQDGAALLAQSHVNIEPV